MEEMQGQCYKDARSNSVIKYLKPRTNIQHKAQGKGTHGIFSKHFPCNLVHSFSFLNGAAHYFPEDGQESNFCSSDLDRVFTFVAPSAAHTNSPWYVPAASTRLSSGLNGWV